MLDIGFLQVKSVHTIIMGTVKNAKKMSKKLRDIPPVHEVVDLCLNQDWSNHYSREQLVKSIRAQLNQMRSSGIVSSKEEVAEQVSKRMEQEHRYSLKKVINATGVIVHTNLGRAPLSQEALKHLMEIASGY